MKNNWIASLNKDCTTTTDLITVDRFGKESIVTKDVTHTLTKGNRTFPTKAKALAWCDLMNSTDKGFGAGTATFIGKQ